MLEKVRAHAAEASANPLALLRVVTGALLLVDSFTTAASLVILWRYLRGDAWRWLPLRWYSCSD